MTNDRGPLLTFEVTWTNGHVEQVKAHQCTAPHGLMFGADSMTPRWMFHGEFDGRWQLVLTAPEPDIRVVRNLDREQAPS